MKPYQTENNLRLPAADCPAPVHQVVHGLLRYVHIQGLWEHSQSIAQHTQGASGAGSAYGAVKQLQYQRCYRNWTAEIMKVSLLRHQLLPACRCLLSHAECMNAMSVLVTADF